MQGIDVRVPYGRFSKKRTRLAALAGTCNDLDIISDPDVNRRIIPINVLSIDFDRYNGVDKVMLFLELHALFLGKFDHNLNREDIERLENASGNHKSIQIEKELLERYFEPNDYLETGDFMTCTDVLHYLSEKTKARINPTILFRHMSKMYQKKQVRGEFGRKRGYLVEVKRGFDV
jgi:predicted P-loop ATPase